MDDMEANLNNADPGSQGTSTYLEVRWKETVPGAITNMDSHCSRRFKITDYESAKIVYREKKHGEGKADVKLVSVNTIELMA